AHANLRGDAQRRCDQREADEIDPEHTPWHVPRHKALDELRSEEMECAEDRQRDRETQIGHGHDLIQAASRGDLLFRSKRPDQEKRDAGSAHRCCRAIEYKKCGENGWVHKFPRFDTEVGILLRAVASTAVLQLILDPRKSTTARR